MLLLHSELMKNLALLTGFQYDLMIIRKWSTFWATLYPTSSIYEHFYASNDRRYSVKLRKKNNIEIKQPQNTKT